jgi:hypothetical protein
VTQENCIKEVQAWAKALGLPDPWQRYVRNAEDAERRGITWALSFEEWWTLWKPHYHQRGPKRGQKVLCRYLDIGDYRIGNVRIDLGANNGVEKGVANRLRTMCVPRGLYKTQVDEIRAHFSAPRPLEPDDALEVARGEVETA